jgi:hypothetical protein
MSFGVIKYFIFILAYVSEQAICCTLTDIAFSFPPFPTLTERLMGA